MSEPVNLALDKLIVAIKEEDQRRQIMSKSEKEWRIALNCSMEASRLAGKIVDAALCMHSEEGKQWGGFASGFRRIAAILEVLGTDKAANFAEPGIKLDALEPPEPGSAST